MPIPTPAQQTNYLFSKASGEYTQITNRQKSIDLYNDLPNRALYLTQFEPSIARYSERVRQSVLHNYYKKTINHIVTVLSFLEFTNNTPLTIAQDLGLGFNLRNFITFADQFAQRDGGLYIDVSDPNKLTHVTLSMILNTKQDSIVYQPVNERTQREVSLADLVTYDYNYGIPEGDSYAFSPVHLALLETNLAWFNLNSNYRATLEYYSKPILVRTRQQLVANNKQEVIDFEAGNKLVELATGEELYFLSLDTDNVAAQQTELIRLEKYMNESLNRVLSLGKDATQPANRTATEIEYIQAETSLDFTMMAQRKHANVSRLMYQFYAHHYPQYTNQIGLSIINPYTEQPAKLSYIDYA